MPCRPAADAGVYFGRASGHAGAVDGERSYDRGRRHATLARAPAVRTEPVAGPLLHTGHRELLRLQAVAGNAAVARALGVQRQGGPNPGITVTPILGSFNEKAAYIHAGQRFDLRYDPVGPLPKIGKATVTLKVNVEFKDFTRAMMRRAEFRHHRWTRAQLRQFAWPDDKKREWVGKFAGAVAAGWKEKHAFVLDETGFEKYRATCDVQVRHVDKAEEANTRITAQWVPPGAPRLRSSVTGGSEANLDVRDVDEPETHRVQGIRFARQIGPFDFDSSELTPTVVSSIAAFETAFKRQREPGRPLAGPIEDVDVGFTGRASSKGSVAYNKKLARARAEAVMDRVMADLDLSLSHAGSVGERHTTEDAKFQRVDGFATKGGQVDAVQNVAAHEAGHMFGLGDEYVDEEPPQNVTSKFEADPARHDADVRAAMGDEAAEETMVADSGSMMSSGSEVKRGHYVYFLNALNSATGHTWKVE